MAPDNKQWRGLHIVDNISEFTGKFFSWLILAIVAVFCWELLLRNVFSLPTIWAHEGSQYIFAFYFTLGGAYALKLGSMVNVDILTNRLKPRTRAVVEGVVGIAAVVFLLALIWKGFDLALHSVEIREASQTPWGPPIYPFKITVVVGALLLGMQALAKLIRDMIFGISGKVWN